MDIFCNAQEISVCEKNKSLYFCSDDIKWTEYPNHTHNYFLHQWQKKWDIHCKHLTHMTTLETWYLRQEIHTYWYMQHIWHVDEFINHWLIQHNYIWWQCFLRSIVQLIQFLLSWTMPYISKSPLTLTIKRLLVFSILYAYFATTHNLMALGHLS